MDEKDSPPQVPLPPPPPTPNRKPYGGAVNLPSPNRVTTPIPGNTTPAPPSHGNTRPGTVASCSDAVTRAQAQPIVRTLENGPETPLTSEKTTVSTSDKKDPVLPTFHNVTTEGSNSGIYGYALRNTAASGSDAVTWAPPHLENATLQLLEKTTPLFSEPSPATPRPSEQLAGTEGLPSFRSPKKPSPVTPRPSEQLAGTEGLPSFRSPKKAQIECSQGSYVGQPSPATPRPSEQLAGTEGLPSFRSPKKRNPDAARILYITFSLWGPDVSPTEISQYFESILGAHTVEHICLSSTLDSEGAKTTDAFVKFKNSNSVEILMGEAEVIEMKIFEKTAHAKRHRG